MTGACALIVKVSAAVPVPVEFVAPKVMLEVPAVVGVPEMTPVDVLMESPDGRPVALKAVGLLVAVIV